MKQPHSIDPCYAGFRVVASKRSPILGYNHNFRHRGRVFHVQTEDSGVDNPHIFTHLFHGGVILSSRKLEYDAASAEELVKSLMQSQHKAVLRDLKTGTFDEKIVAYLGPHPDDRDESARPETVDPSLVPRGEPPPVSVQFAPTAPIHDPPSEPVEIHQARPDEPGHIHSPAPPGAPTPPGSSTYIQKGSVRREAPLLTTSQMLALIGDADDDAAEPVRAERPVQPVQPRAPTPSKPPPIPMAARRRPTRPPQRFPSTQPRSKPGSAPPPIPATRTPSGLHRSSGSVVVSRPAVIVGAPPKVVGGDAGRGQPRGRNARATASSAPPSSAPPPSSRPRARARAAREEKASDSLFGGDLISEKSLDEVILAYLSEDTEE